jgi:hypothetical protein
MMNDNNDSKIVIFLNGGYLFGIFISPCIYSRLAARNLAKKEGKETRSPYYLILITYGCENRRVFAYNTFLGVVGYCRAPCCARLALLQQDCIVRGRDNNLATVLTPLVPLTSL